MMTTPVLIVLLFVAAMTMAALGGWTRHKRKERATTHDDEDDVFSRAPRFAGILNQKLNLVLAGQRRLHRHIDSEAEADEERDRKMHDEIIAELNAATSERAGFMVILKALQDNAGDPVKLQEIAQSVKTGRQEWLTAFAANVPA